MGERKSLDPRVVFVALLTFVSYRVRLIRAWDIHAGLGSSLTLLAADFPASCPPLFSRELFD